MVKMNGEKFEVMDYQGDIVVFDVLEIKFIISIMVDIVLFEVQVNFFVEFCDEIVWIYICVVILSFEVVIIIGKGGENVFKIR